MQEVFATLTISLPLYKFYNCISNTYVMLVTYVRLVILFNVLNILNIDHYALMYLNWIRVKFIFYIKILYIYIYKLDIYYY